MRLAGQRADLVAEGEQQGAAQQQPGNEMQEGMLRRLEQKQRAGQPSDYAGQQQGNQQACGTFSRLRYAPVLAAKPGHSATVLVALASTAGMPVANSAGNETKVPPPATAFSVPAITAAKEQEDGLADVQRVILAVQFEVGGLELAPICAGLIGDASVYARWRPTAAHLLKPLPEMTAARAKQTASRDQSNRVLDSTC